MCIDRGLIEYAINIGPVTRDLFGKPGNGLSLLLQFFFDFSGSIIVSAAFKYFRNIRNQKSMMEMQQDIARRAEYEAKRHAYNYTRNKTNEMVNSARRNTQKIVNNKVRQSGGNKPKNFSI